MSIIVKVSEKLSSHPFYGQGSKMGYTINGHSGPTLNLKRGTTVIFDIDTKDHPFYFTTDSTGGKGFPGSIMGKTLAVEVGKMTITVDGRFPSNQQIYYQCGVHPKMGGYVMITEPKINVKRGDIVRVNPKHCLRHN